MTLILPNGVASVPHKLPPVVVDFVVDDDQQCRLARSEQRWWKLGADPVSTEIWLPVCDGFSGELDVLLPDVAARRYIIKFMNMKARRMIAAGYKPQLKTEVESAMMAFATPINGNGTLQ